MARCVLDVNTVVSEVWPLLDRLIGEHVELVVTLAAGPLTVEADPTELQQTIVNLATNARDAMAGSGRLAVRTGLVDGAPAGTTLPEGRYVSLTVQDTGLDMDAATRTTVLHPFFTTRDVGEGTGIGLATVHGIVEQSGGHVVVESAPGLGSSFRVFLPFVVGDTLAPAAAPATGAARPVSQATILLVEDEALVRTVMARVLGRAGYAVVEAQDGEQAWHTIRRPEMSIDLVISDVVMARIGGRELARRLTKERPGIPILLVSGYNREETLPRDELVGGVGFLPKPFTPSELLDAVASLLAPSAGRLARRPQQSSA